MYSNYGNYGVTTSPAAESSFETFINNGGGVVIVLGLILGLIILALVVLMLIAQCKVFTKAGEKWWKVFIPLYNTWVQTRITGLAWWWFPIYVGVGALMLNYPNNYILSIMLFLVSYNYMFNMAKKFGKSTGFAVLLAILPVIGLPILAFGSSSYDKNAKVDQNGIFALEK